MHLEVDLALLDDTASDLRSAVEVARDVAKKRHSLMALVTSVGSPAVGDAARDFVEAWGYGMELVVDDAERLASMLEEGRRAYLANEEAIAGGTR